MCVLSLSLSLSIYIYIYIYINIYRICICLCYRSGPTRKFFEKVAALLASEEENGACKVCETPHTTLTHTRSLSHTLTHTNTCIYICKVWRDTGDASKCGLFPAKLPQDQEARSLALKRLQLIGLFMGKALQQGQMPGLCLAKPLYKLIIGQPVGYDDVKDFDRELAAGVESLLVPCMCVRLSVCGCGCGWSTVDACVCTSVCVWMRMCVCV